MNWKCTEGHCRCGENPDNIVVKNYHGPDRRESVRRYVDRDNQAELDLKVRQPVS